MEQSRLGGEEPERVAVVCLPGTRKGLIDFMLSQGVEGDGVVLEFANEEERNQFIEKARAALGSANIAAYKLADLIV